MRRFLTFRLSTLLLLMVTLAVALGWWRDHSKLQQQVAEGTLLRQALRETLFQLNKGAFLESWFQRHLEPHVGQINQRIDERFAQDFRDSDVGRATSSGEFEKLSHQALGAKMASFVTHPSAAVRAHGVFALLGGAIDSREETAKCLEKCLQDDDEIVRWNALLGLERLGTAAASAVPTLRKIAEGPPSIFSVSALALLLRFDPPAEIVARLLQVIDEAGGKTRLWAVWLLREVPPAVGAAAVPKLMTFLDDSDNDLRQAATCVLGAVGAGETVTRNLLHRFQTAEAGLDREALVDAIQCIEARAVAPPEAANAYPATTRPSSGEDSSLWGRVPSRGGTSH